MSEHDDAEGAPSPWWLQINNSRDVTRFEVVGDRAATRLELVEALAMSAPFRRLLTRLLVKLPAEQIYWETPPLSTSTAGRPAEFVAVPARLTSVPDSSVFGHVLTLSDPVVTFPNLQGDALLVAPTKQDPETRYNYLLSFLRTGTPEQIDAMWSAVGQAALSRLGTEPIWVSTSGGGVAWLHVRIDSSPKYYTHSSYRDAGQ